LMRAGADRHRQCLFLLDETASLGKLDVLSEAITQVRGFGLRSMLVYQALAQLQQQFPEGQHETVLAQCDQLYLGIRDLPTAKLVSEQCGNYTGVARNVGDNEGDSHSEGRDFSRSYSSGRSRGASEVSAPLLRPEDVLQMGNRTAVAFIQNLPPLLI